MSANIVATEKVMIDPINAPPDGEYSVSKMAILSYSF